MAEGDGLDGYADLAIAAVAAGCAIVLTLALEYGLGADIGVAFRLAPLYAYFVYLLVDNSGVLSPRNSVPVWSGVIAAVTVLTAVIVLV